MTDNDIREYLRSLEEPVFLKEALHELRASDPTISQKRVARLMREVGFENRPCKNARNPKGKGSAWFRTENAVTTDDDDYDEVDDDEVDDDDVEETEETEGKPRSTTDALNEVNAQNTINAELSAKLFESLNRSRDLKAELMRRQQEALLELARRILGLYGSEKERKVYGDF